MRSVVFLFLLLILPFHGASALEAAIPKGAVVVAPLRGEVTDAQFIILRRALKAAEAANAVAFVIEMDTPGGSLSAAVEILNLLLHSTIPTYTWVNTNAGSAGALIALGTSHIYMAPVSAIGAAAPVMSGGQEMSETMSAKIISYYSGYFRSAAEKNGYNPELAEAFINKDKELQIDNQVKKAKGSLLTLSAQEAVKKIQGKPLLASGIAETIQQLVAEAGFGNAVIYRFEPSGFEQVGNWITTLAPLFLLGGIIGVYLEFKAPGFGVAGAVAAVCFLLFFAGHYIAGMTGYEAVVIFAFGVLLVGLELALFPGVFVIAGMGLMVMIVGILFAMVDYWPSRPFSLDTNTILPPLLNLAITIFFSVLAIGLLARYLPSAPFFRGLILNAHVASGASIAEPTHCLPHAKVALGDKGATRSILRPSGKAVFGDLLVDVTTEGDFIGQGALVRVVRMDAGQIYVELLPKEGV